MNLNKYIETYGHLKESRYGIGLATPNPEQGDVYGCMLVFNEDTAHIWSGPFPGNTAAVTITDRRCSPRYTLATLDELFIRQHKYYRCTRETHERCREQWISDCPSQEFPIVIHISGSDDTSYSLFLKTVDEAKELLHLFQCMEPLDFYEDVMPYGFVFTN